MTNHEKKWLLYDDRNKKFFEKDFANIFNDSQWMWFDYFYKEIYDCEYSKTNCVYEMSDCIINKDDVVVDLGANVGFFTNYAAQKCKKVISVEGGDAFFSCLVKNTYENGNVEYLNANVVAENSKINNTWANPTKINLTISNIFDLYNLDKINFLKIDIEGSEYDIFKSIDKNILSRIEKISVELHDTNRNDELITNINKNNLFRFDWCVGGNEQTTFYFNN